MIARVGRGSGKRSPSPPPLLLLTEIISADEALDVGMQKYIYTHILHINNYFSLDTMDLTALSAAYLAHGGRSSTLGKSEETVT